MNKKPLLTPLSENGKLIATILFSSLLMGTLLLSISKLLLPTLSPIQRLLCTAALLLAGLISLSLILHSRAGLGLRFSVKLYAVLATVLFWLEADLFVFRTALLLANPLPLYLAAMVLGVVACGVVAVPWRKTHKGSLPLSLMAAVTISGFMLGRSLLMAGNILFDTTPFQSVIATATGVYEKPQGSYTHFYITLEENSLVAQSARLPLTPEEYLSSHTGDHFLLSIHKGAFGITWADVIPAT